MTNNQRLSVTFLLAWVVVTSSGIVHAQEPSSTLQQLLDAAYKLSDLSSLRPYVLRARVIANPGDKEKERTGNLTLYRDRGRSRLELSLGNTQEIRVVLGDRQYISLDTAWFPATRLATFESSWLPPRSAAGGVLNQVTQTRAGSQEAWCADLKEGSILRHLCLDSTRPVLLSTETPYEKAEFFDYAAVGELWFPGRAVIAHQDSTPVELDDVQILPGPLDANLFNVPARSIEIEGCRNQQPAKASYHFEPKFPESERKRKKQGSVFLSVVVDKEGKLVAVRVMDATSEAFAHESLDAIQQWKFQPALCANRPVNQEMTVSFAFKLY
jgi:TonB family protein